MGLFDRISRVVRGNLNDLVSKAEEPEKILEQAVVDMQEDLGQLRQAVAKAIASQKRTEQQYSQVQSEAAKWHQRAQLALQKGDETLAREALVRKKAQTDTGNTLKIQLDQQTGQVDTMKKNMIALQSKIAEAKTKKDMLKARAAAAKANEQLHETMGSLGTSSALAAFERMEDKVLQMEAKSAAIGELVGDTDLESQFAALEAGSDVDDELAALKAQMLAPASEDPAQLPAAEQPPMSAEQATVDAELETLRSQIDQLP